MRVIDCVTQRAVGRGERPMSVQVCELFITPQYTDLDRQTFISTSVELIEVRSCTRVQKGQFRCANL